MKTNPLNITDDPADRKPELKPSPVCEELDSLAKRLCSLSDTIDGLEKQLRPVLKDLPAPEPASGKEVAVHQKSPPASPLVSLIRDQDETVDYLTGKVSRIIGSLTI